MSDANLANVSTGELAKALHQRLIAESSTAFWSLDEVFDLMRATGVLPCVDGFPVRWKECHVPEIGFILRHTGRYKGKWWDVGGRIYRGESFSQSLRRHFQEVLGVGISLPSGLAWNEPIFVSQQGPERLVVEDGEFAGDEPSKYCIAPTYLVELTSETFIFGSTAHGGQEATDFRWFPIDALPSEAEIAYGGMRTVLACARWAREHL